MGSYLSNMRLLHINFVLHHVGIIGGTVKDDRFRNPKYAQTVRRNLCQLGSLKNIVPIVVKVIIFIGRIIQLSRNSVLFVVNILLRQIGDGKDVLSVLSMKVKEYREYLQKYVFQYCLLKVINVGFVKGS